MTENINTAILAIMQEVSYVQKEKSKDVNYTLKTENAVIQAIRPAMLKQGVFMYPVGVKDIHESQFEAGKYKNIWNRVLCVHVFRFEHAASGTHIDVEVLGDGADTGDKAGNKSMTTAKKYALLETFLLETGDDPDTTPSPTDTSKSNGNGHKAENTDEIITDALWGAWVELKERAAVVKLDFPNLDRAKVTAPRLKKIAKELRENVEQAEAQAKVGE